MSHYYGVEPLAIRSRGKLAGRPCGGRIEDRIGAEINPIDSVVEDVKEKDTVSTMAD